MKNQKILTLLWIASLLTKVVYTFLWYDRSQDTTRVNSNPSSVIITAVIYGVIGLISVIFAIYLSKQLQSPPLFLVKMMGLKSEGNSENLGFLFTITTVSLGCVEIPVVFGLVYSILNGNAYIYFGFLALSLIGWVLTKPKIQTKRVKLGSETDLGEFPSPE